MIRPAINAGIITIAFSNVAQAEQMPDFSNTHPAESSYTTLINSGSCLLASEALQSSNNALTEDQEHISDMIDVISSTEIGAIVTQRNASENIFYCYWDQNPEFLGLFLPSLRMASVFDNAQNNVKEINTMAEEIIHAYQFETNVYLENYSQLGAYDRYASEMAAEAQAKIWREKIMNDLGIYNEVDTPDYPGDIVATTVTECYMQSGGVLNSACLEHAFSSIYQIDNPYTNHVFNNAYLSYEHYIHKNPEAIENLKGICAPNFSEAFGYIVNDGQRVQYLPSNYDPADIIRFDRDQRPSRDTFHSWQNPAMLKVHENVATLDEMGRPVIQTKYPCL